MSVRGTFLDHLSELFRWVHGHRDSARRSVVLIMVSVAALVGLPRLGLADQTADIEAVLAVVAPWWGRNSGDGAVTRELHAALQDARATRDHALELAREQMAQSARLLDLIPAQYREAPTPPSGGRDGV
jgi:type II secretory pathway pseudopilin PulG